MEFYQDPVRRVRSSEVFSLVEMDDLPEVFFKELVKVLLANKIRFKENFEEAMYSQGFTMNQVAKECGILKSCAHQGILSELVVEAHSKKVISDVNTWDVKDAIELAKWCETEVGKNAIDLAGSRTNKKRKHAIAGDTKMENLWKRICYSVIPQDSPWVSIFNLQLDDLNADVSSYKMDAMKKISHLRSKMEAKIKVIEKGIKNYEDERKRIYNAAGRYKPLYQEQISRQCWERYLKEHQQKSLPLPVFNEINVMGALRRHEDSVIQEHKDRFCADDSVRNELERYLKGKLQSLKSGFRLAKKYKAMLVDAGCEVSEEALVGVETFASQAGPSGESANTLATLNVSSLRDCAGSHIGASQD